jgi:hypothetical protein
MRRVADPPGTPVRGFRFGRVAAFKSEPWPASFRNGGRHQIGMPGRNASEFAGLSSKVVFGVSIALNFFIVPLLPDGSAEQPTALRNTLARRKASPPRRTPGLGYS